MSEQNAQPPVPSAPRVQAHERPLSPHLSIYRQPLTAGVLSITHRITGVFLSLGLVLFVAWLWLAAYCPDYYPQATAYSTTKWGTGLLMLWSLAFFYHFLNGVRHLGWDMGQGLELAAAARSGWMSLIGSFVITAFIWYMLLA